MDVLKFLFGFTIENDFSDRFFTGAGIYICVAAIVLVLGLLVLICLSNRKNVYNVYALAFAAVCIGLSFGLSYWTPLSLPQGGSVTIASLLPICLYAYVFGFKRGLLAGLVYSILQIIQKPYIYNLTQVLLDYILAFSTVSISGLAPLLFKKWKEKNRLGAFLARFDFSISLVLVGAARYVFHVLSGALFFGSWAMPGYSAWGWALLYNLFVFADIALCVIPAVLLQLSPQFMRFLSGIRYRVTARDRAEALAEEKAR